MGEFIFPFGFSREVATKGTANKILLAAHQSGVQVEIAALPGQEYKTLDGTKLTVPEDSVCLTIGRNAVVGRDNVKFGQRRSVLDKVLGGNG